MQGGTRNCPGFPCKQNIVFLTCHRRLAGRDPTARRWSPKAKCFKAAAESGVPGVNFINFMPFMVRLHLPFFVFFMVEQGCFSVFSVTSVVKMVFFCVFLCVLRTTGCGDFLARIIHFL